MPFPSPLTPSSGDSSLDPKRRAARYADEPGYYEPAELWFYGNVRLLHGELSHVTKACGPGVRSMKELQELEEEAEAIVLSGKVLVCGIHNVEHQRAAVVPLRWGAPRIVVFSGGIRFHLGKDLRQEPFPVGRLWRYSWDPLTDLAVSRRAPDALPTFAMNNPTVERLIKGLVNRSWPGLFSPTDALSRPLPRTD